MRDRDSRFQFGQTHWSLVFQAGEKEGDTGATARNELLIRYHEAVYRYLCAQVKDVNAAGELFSRFAERVLEIHPFLERADPEKGRFRDYLRSILHRMVIDYYRGCKHPDGRPFGPSDPAAPEPAEADAEFRKVWAEELLNLAWRELENLERQGGQPYHTLILYKAQNPQVRSEAMAQHFTKVSGRAFSAANVRQLLHRGQQLLNDLLVREVARTLEKTRSGPITARQIEDELLELQLLDTPRKEALNRYQG